MPYAAQGHHRLAAGDAWAVPQLVHDVSKVIEVAHAQPNHRVRLTCQRRSLADLRSLHEVFEYRLYVRVADKAQSDVCLDRGLQLVVVEYDRVLGDHAELLQPSDTATDGGRGEARSLCHVGSGLASILTEHLQDEGVLVIEIWPAVHASYGNTRTPNARAGVTRDSRV